MSPAAPPLAPSTATTACLGKCSWDWSWISDGVETVDSRSIVYLLRELTSHARVSISSENLWIFHSVISWLQPFGLPGEKSAVHRSREGGAQDRLRRFQSLRRVPPLHLQIFFPN